MHFKRETYKYHQHLFGFYFSGIENNAHNHVKLYIYMYIPGAIYNTHAHILNPATRETGITLADGFSAVAAFYFYV